MSVKVVAKGEFIEDKLEEVKRIYTEMTSETLKEEGCVSFGLYEDIDDRCILTVIEEWKGTEYLKNHAKSPHYLKLIPLVRECRKSLELRIYRQII